MPFSCGATTSDLTANDRRRLTMPLSSIFLYLPAFNDIIYTCLSQLPASQILSLAYPAKTGHHSKEVAQSHIASKWWLRVLEGLEKLVANFGSGQQAVVKLMSKEEMDGVIRSSRRGRRIDGKGGKERRRETVCTS